MRRDEHLSAMPHKNTYLHLHFDSKLELDRSGQIGLGCDFTKRRVGRCDVTNGRSNTAETDIIE